MMYIYTTTQKYKKGLAKRLKIPKDLSGIDNWRSVDVLSFHHVTLCFFL